MRVRSPLRLAATALTAVAVLMGAVPAAAVPYRDDVLSDSPSGYWRLGEASGVFAADSAGPNTGSYLNGPLLGRPGALGSDADTAVQFDGSNDFVRVPDATTLDLGDSFTLEA